MVSKTKSGFISFLLVSLVVISLLLSACSPAVSPTVPAEKTLAPTTAPAPTEIIATEPSVSDGELGFSIDMGSLATGYQMETIPAVPAGDNVPDWEVLPEYTRVTLQGYPISEHLMQPQIFIYPLAELGTANEGAGQIATLLQDWLRSPQEIKNMPFLPLFNAGQVIHVQVQALEFKTGKGVRYLTQFSQGIVPINNQELIYTYQGVTGDGKYYVAAVLPIHSSSLPTDGTVTGNEPAEFTSDFPTYLTNAADKLNSQPANAFTPDLMQLDAMIGSLKIK